MIIPDHALGLPVLRALSLCTCRRHYPGCSSWAHFFAQFAQPFQPSPIWQSGRPTRRPFRGLLDVHSRYGLHTRAVTVYRDTLTRGFSHFVTSMTAPVASGWSGCRVGLAPTGKRRLATAHANCGPHPNRRFRRKADVRWKAERPKASSSKSLSVRRTKRRRVPAHAAKRHGGAASWFWPTLQSYRERPI